MRQQRCLPCVPPHEKETGAQYSTPKHNDNDNRS
jgi:hypothetical protein